VGQATNTENSKGERIERFGEWIQITVKKARVARDDGILKEFEGERSV